MQGTTDKQPTCAERIDEHLTGRIDQINELFEAIDKDQASGIDEDYEEALQTLEESPLWIDRSEVWRIQMSTGGPGDDFYVTYDRKNDDVERIEYAFLDWFDGARRTLEGEQFDLIERYARQLTADFYSQS